MVQLSNKQLIDGILALPNAPKIINTINIKLKEEKQRREAFYNDITEQEKAEFINGEIIIHSPVKKEHNDASNSLNQLISAYVNKQELGYVGYEKIMISLSRNDYEPDICFFKKETAKTFKKGQSLFPTPDLVVEVLSKGTQRYDRSIKYDDYQAHGVSEYWIIDPNKTIVEQYRLNKEGMYDLVLKSKEGKIVCEPIKGFEIAIELIFDDQKNVAELLRILTA